MRDLSLERHLPMREQHYQSHISTISNGRVKPTQPPTVPQDYYGTMMNLISPGTRLILLAFGLRKDNIVESVNQRRRATVYLVFELIECTCTSTIRLTTEVMVGNRERTGFDKQSRE